MLDQLESNYDCSNAGEDLPRLLAELDRMKSDLDDESSKGDIEAVHRLENQIEFIRNKCAIR